MSVAASLVEQFGRMVARDGGELTLLSEDVSEVRIGYRSGVDPTCEAGVCVLPHLELQLMMAEALARRAPGLRLVVEPQT